MYYGSMLRSGLSRIRAALALVCAAALLAGQPSFATVVRAPVKAVLSPSAAGAPAAAGLSLGTSPGNLRVLDGAFSPGLTSVLPLEPSVFAAMGAAPAAGTRAAPAIASPRAVSVLSSPAAAPVRSAGGSPAKLGVRFSPGKRASAKHAAAPGSSTRSGAVPGRKAGRVDGRSIGTRSAGLFDGERIRARFLEGALDASGLQSLFDGTGRSSRLDRSAAATAESHGRQAVPGVNVFLPHGLEPAAAVDEDPVARPASKAEVSRAAWTKWTKRFTHWAAGIFLFIQAPQFIKNIGFLAAGDAWKIGILPWMGYTTGTLASMLLLTHFVDHRERGAIRAQTISMVANLAILTQIFIGGFMPWTAFALLASAVAVNLVLSILRMKGKLSDRIWNAWKRAIGLVGAAILPAVLVPMIVPGAGIAALAAGAVVPLLWLLQRAGLFKNRLDRFWDGLTGWTAALLFMLGALAMLHSTLVNPGALPGLSLTMMLMGYLGNSLMLPRAALVKDKIWFVSTLWVVLVGSLGVFINMAVAGVISPMFLAALGGAFPVFLAWLLLKAKRFHGESSLRKTLAFAVKSAVR